MKRVIVVGGLEPSFLADLYRKFLVVIVDKPED